MIPVYNPDADYLRQTINSVVTQFGDNNSYQLAIVDDASTDFDTSNIPENIPVYRNKKNQGLACTWNRCIELAEGEYIHILHQDDYVLDGYYREIGNLLESDSSVGAAFCRTIHMDSDGYWKSFSKLYPKRPGVFRSFLNTIAKGQILECPTISVKKEVYQQLGGFRTDLIYALDWEMWVRIGAYFKVAYHPQPMACFRIHENSQTARLRKDANSFYDELKAIPIITKLFPEDRKTKLYRRALEAKRKKGKKLLKKERDPETRKRLKAELRKISPGLKEQLQLLIS